MKPLRLEMTAFGPYLDTQAIDFDRLGEHGLFLIHGRTGSGKSSILDALCFALYGETTGGERGGQDMVTTLDQGLTAGAVTRAATKVVLEFEHLGTHYRVTRQPTQEVAKVRGDGTRTRQADATLEDLDSGVVVAAKVRDVTAAVKEMLRCDVDQFRQTVVLPQGDFRRVVTDDGARRTILTRIFRTQKFERVAVRLKEYAKGLANQGKAIREQRERLLSDLGAANVAELDELLTASESEALAAAERRSAAANAKDVAVAARAVGHGLEADFSALETLRVLADDLHSKTEQIEHLSVVVERASKAATLSDSRDHLDQRTEEHARLQVEVSRAEAARKATRAALEDARSELERAEASDRSALEAADLRYKHLLSQRENVAGLNALRTSLAEARHVLEEGTGRLVSVDEALAELKSRIDELEEEAQQTTVVASELDAAREALVATAGDLDAWDRLTALDVELKSVDSEIERARAEDARHHLETAVRTNAPGLLASSLVTGEPCPVCGSVHHPALSSAEDVEALTRAFETFGASAALREVLAERRRVIVAAMIESRDSRGWSGETPDRDVLEQRRVSATERTDAAEAARARLVEIANELATVRTVREERFDERKREADAVARQQALAQNLENEIAVTLRALPEEHRDPAAFDMNLEASRMRFEELKQRLADAARKVQDAELEDGKATTRLGGLEGQLATAAETLDRAGAEFLVRLTSAGFRDRADFEAAELDQDELADQRTTVEAHRKAVSDTAAGIEALGTRLRGSERPDLEALESALQEAEQQSVHADQNAAAANQRRDVIKLKRDQFEELEKRDSELAARRDAAVKLDQLANGQLSGRVKVKLETFVLQSIFHEVLEEGNRHLRHMTGGRYTLMLSETVSASDSGLELDVRDNAAGGATRPVATLSGGEGFLASLALALGLSEVAQRRSGGTELGALFVDEGFGSLDPDALDQVVGILRGLQDGHRMVGVISHVEELKRRIPAQLQVVTGHTGSRVEMRLND